MSTRERVERFNWTLQGPWSTEPTTETEYRVEWRMHSSWACGDPSVFITFPPTTDKSVLDWLQNLSFWKVPYRNMAARFYVHAGFLKKYKAVRNVILSMVMDFKPKEILIQGYSQGGALAQLAHEDLRYQVETGALSSYVSTFTYGSPRVFASIGAVYLLRERMSSHIRFVNGDDLVTHLPPRVLLYRDYGKLQHIGASARPWRISVEDHLPGSYLKSLESV